MMICTDSRFVEITFVSCVSMISIKHWYIHVLNLFGTLLQVGDLSSERRDETQLAMLNCDIDFVVILYMLLEERSSG